MLAKFTAPNPIKHQRGGALLEVLISIIILALGILALIGLQASMSANASEAKYRSEASYLANQLIGQMWVDQGNLEKYVIDAGTCAETYGACSNWVASVSGRLPSGTATVTVNNPTVNIRIDWKSAGGGSSHNYQLQALVLN